MLKQSLEILNLCFRNLFLDFSRMFLDFVFRLNKKEIIQSERSNGFTLVERSLSYSLYIMYKVSVLNLFFDYFSHYRFVSNCHSQIICSRWQSIDVDFVCIKESHNDFADIVYHFYLFYLFAER